MRCAVNQQLSGPSKLATIGPMSSGTPTRPRVGHAGELLVEIRHVAHRAAGCFLCSVPPHIVDIAFDTRANARPHTYASRPATSEAASTVAYCSSVIDSCQIMKYITFISNISVWLLICLNSWNSLHYHSRNSLRHGNCHLTER